MLLLIIQLILSQFSSVAPTLLVTGQALVCLEHLCQESAHQSPSFLLTAAMRLLSNYLWTWKQFHFLERHIGAPVSSFSYTRDRPPISASCQMLPPATQSKSFSETKERINLQYLIPKSYIKVDEYNPCLLPQPALSWQVVSEHFLKHQ